MQSPDVNLIYFHGMTLWVIAHENIDYVPLRPLVDLVGLDWKSARQSAISGDNPRLFDSKELEDPVFNVKKGGYPPKKQLYIRLDRARMYLARINTSRMRSHDNGEAADKLLALQIEWAQVLHDYETKGFAKKSNRGVNVVNTLAKIDKIKDPVLKQRAAKEANTEFGIDIPLANQEELKLS